MRVLLVVLHAQVARGGAEGYSVHLLNALRGRGIDARVASASFDDNLDPSVRVPLDFGGFTRTNRYRRFLASLDAHLEASRYDIVHAALPVRRCDVYHPHAGIESVTFPRISKLQQWTNRRRACFARMEKSLLEGRNPPVVLCLSDRSREETRQALRIEETLLITLRNGVDSERFDFRRYTSTPVDPPQLLIAGHDFHRKGVDIAIRAVAGVEACVLNVVGNDNPATFSVLARQLNVERRVRFVGPTQDVPAMLARASALLLPARFEPFGLVVPEAMLMGVPPIVSRLAGASEIVRDGIDGRVVDGHDPAAWSQAIRDVLGKQVAMRKACLQRRGDLSYDVHLDKMVSIYETILAARQTSAVVAMPMDRAPCFTPSCRSR
jgi:UDP-glucose:(heptosyl)LPS alpha-1,3-glucosyltransferase